MGVSIDNTKAFMDGKGMHYRATGDGKALFVGIGDMDNSPDIDILIVFGDDDKHVQMRLTDMCKFPEGKMGNMFKTCSDVNARFRWIKFYVNRERVSITAETDAVISPETAGSEVFELIMRMANIVDEAYPTFMKAVWS